MMRSTRFTGLAAGAAAALLGVANVGHAAFTSPTSWTRQVTSNTTYQHWDIFGGYPTDSSPDVGDFNANGTASLTETSGSAFLTGGGNIYSFSAATDFVVTIPEADIPSPDHNVTALVQIKTLGNELDYDSVLINGLSPVASEFLTRIVLGGMGGSDVEAAFVFNIPYAAFGDGVAGVENLSLTFNASASSMSLDQLSIDTALSSDGFYSSEITGTIPEPASLALLGLGGMAIFSRGRGRAVRRQVVAR